MNARQLTILFVYCGSLLGAQSHAADPDPAERTWRRDDRPLDHAGIEELARRVGYAGGRLEAGEGPRADDRYDGERNSELLAIRGDKPFRENLQRNGLELLDQIDNRATGLQAVLVRDARGDGRVYAIMRGTEFSVSTNNERLRDGFADANTNRIGYHQYEADKATLAQWAHKHNGNLTVTGHSLGAALAQRFVLDHPSAVKEVVAFNPPALDEESCKRLALKQLPPVTYYVQPRDPVSRLGGACHVPGRVFKVEGGNTETFNPNSKWLAEHRGYMLGDGTTVNEVNFGQWQSERTQEINAAWTALGRAGEGFKQNPPVGTTYKLNPNTVHKLVGDSQVLVSLYRQIINATEVSSAKVREVGAARYDGMVQIEEMRKLLGQMRGAAENCQSAAAVRDRIVAHAAQVVKFADTADAGFQYAQKQSRECKSVEAITAALSTHDKSRALMKSASDHYGQMREGERLLADLLTAATQGKGMKDAATAKLTQARGTLERMRVLAGEAEALRQRAAAATTEYMRMRSVVRKMYATLPSALSAEATRMMMESWDRPEPSIAELPAERGVAASTINAFESAVSAAEAELKGGDGLQACNTVALPEDRIGAADAAMVSMGLDGMGDGTREEAQACLVRLRYGKTQQAAAGTQRRAAANSELDDLLNDVAANQTDAQAAHRGQQAMMEDDREKAQNVGGTSYRESRGEAPVTESSRPVMEGLLSTLTEAVRQVQHNSAQRPPLTAPREAPRPSGNAATPRPPAAPASPRAPAAPASAARPAQDDRQFIIVGSAFPASDANYRNHVACRHIRALAGPYFLEGREQAIPETVARIKAKGHVDVEVKYGPADSGERLAREWERIFMRGAEACREAVRREREHLEPRSRRNHGPANHIERCGCVAVERLCDGDDRALQRAGAVRRQGVPRSTAGPAPGAHGEDRAADLQGRTAAKQP